MSLGFILNNMMNGMKLRREHVYKNEEQKSKTFRTQNKRFNDLPAGNQHDFSCCSMHFHVL